MAESLAKKLFVVPRGDSARTFKHDDRLPRLPVPSLRHTLDRYLDSIRPFVTNDEFARTAHLVNEFEQGVGQKLQTKLKERAKHERNWLERWWEDVVYLTNRQPLLPFSHMMGIAVTNKFMWKTGEANSQIKNAAFFCYFTTELWLLLRQERWRPHQTRDTKKYLSMYGFRRFFNCARIPGESWDTLALYFRTVSEGFCPSHVIILCNGRIFYINALDEAGNPLTPPEWEQQLSAIREKSHAQKGSGIPLLTCTDRTTWAKNRRYLENLDVENSKALNSIDTSMFVLTLDMDSARTASDIVRLTMCGDLTNRWADKSFGSVFYQNGVDGVLSEHAAYDGMVSIMSMNYVILRLGETDFQWLGPQTVRDLPAAQEIVLTIDDHIKQELQRASVQLAPNRDCVTFVREKFSGFGKELIRTFGFHPDSFIQMALQVAYYRMHGRPAPTYETATTREFYHGRTETVRSCTAEAVQWVQAMLSSDSSNAKKRDLLRIAIQKHDLLMKEAKVNEGCDRHLLGLYCIAMEQGETIPEIFTDPAFTKSGGNGNFILSTSLVGYSPLGGAVAPMCKDGYGCFYNVNPDRKMLEVLKQLKSHVRLGRHSPDHVTVDTVVSALHYNVTKLLIFVFLTVVTTRQYFGEPILCMQDAKNDAAAIPSRVLNTYCFITSTYTVVGSSGSSTWQGQGKVERRHAYYQWVPFTLLLQALLFVMPHSAWLYWEGGLIHNVMLGLGTGLQGTDRDKLRILARYTGARLNTFKFWAVGFYVCQLLNLLNVVANVFLTDFFLGGSFCQYGLQMSLYGLQTPSDAMFPKLTKCLFRKYGPSGTIQTHDALCVMSLNVVNEKIYTALWFWFSLLVILSVLAIVWRFILLALLTCASSYSRSFVAKWAQRALGTPVTLDPTYLSPVIQRLDFGDWLFLELLASNMTGTAYKEFIDQLVHVMEQVKHSEMQPLWNF